MDTIRLRLRRIKKSKIDEGSTFSDSDAWNYVQANESDYSGGIDFVLPLFKKSHASQALTHVIFYAGIAVSTLAILEIIAQINDTKLQIYNTKLHMVDPLGIAGLVVIAVCFIFEILFVAVNKWNDKMIRKKLCQYTPKEEKWSRWIVLNVLNGNSIENAGHTDEAVYMILKIKKTNFKISNNLKVVAVGYTKDFSKVLSDSIDKIYNYKAIMMGH
jgi:hypothetical protein